MTPLDRGVDVLIPVRSLIDYRRARPRAFGKTAVRLVRPLHSRPRTIAFRQVEIVPHAEFIAIANHRSSRQREHQAIGELEAALISSQHRGKATSDSAIIELHVFVRAERLEHCLSLLLLQTTEIELVV